MKPRVLYRGKGVTPAQSLKKAAESVKSVVLSLQVSFFHVSLQNFCISQENLGVTFYELNK